MSQHYKLHWMPEAQWQITSLAMALQIQREVHDWLANNLDKDEVVAALRWADELSDRHSTEGNTE